MNPQQAPTRAESPQSFTAIVLIIVATFTMLVARWTGFVAVPIVVILAPLTAWFAILVLTLILGIIATILVAVARGGK